jgi:hypothetical protein
MPPKLCTPGADPNSPGIANLDAYRHEPVGAGRILFSSSRQDKRSHNDADRLRKYLARWKLGFDELRGGMTTARPGLNSTRPQEIDHLMRWWRT